MIIASDTVVEMWRAEADRAVQTARTPADPAIVDALLDAPPALAEWTSHLCETLARLGGILLGSALQASPMGDKAFREGMARLADEVARVDPLEEDLAVLVADDQAQWAAGDDGCEGGRA